MFCAVRCYCLSNLAISIHFRIGVLNYKSITITVGFGCFFGIVCIFGMGYVVYGDRCRITNILSHRNHIARIVDSDISNIRRFTQYAASCE